MQLMKRKGQLNVGALVGAAIGILIAIALVDPINNTIVNAGFTGTVQTLAALITTVFIAAIVTASAVLVTRGGRR